MKVIVLSLSSFKESDVIYNAISEESSLSFKAYRGQDNKSQYLWLNNPLVIADVEFADRRYKYPTLKEAKLIASPLKGDNQLEYLYSIAAITEIANNVLPEEERHKLFSHIEKAIIALQNNKDHLMVISILLANAARLAGGELEVDQCVFCGATSDIVAFSFADGGFVCRNCLADSMIADLSATQMKLIRYVFKAPNYDCPESEKYKAEDKKVVLNNLVHYISDMNGVNLKTISNLLE